MSMFEDINSDAVSVAPAAVSYGPRLGFLGAFEASWEQQVRVNSMYGLEQAFRQREQEQIEALKRAGLKPHRSLNDVEDGRVFGGGDFTNSRRYIDAARFFQDGAAPGDEGFGGFIAERERQINQLKIQHPELGLRTYSEMWADVRQRAQGSNERAERSPTTWGGLAGGLAGAVVGSMDPRTDPWNLATLGVGAVGQTAFRRIATQGAGQGAIEAVNQITGVQESRRLLGVDYGLAQGAMSVGGAILGGAGLQAVGEGIGALGRRWFRSTPSDPAPPPPARPVEPFEAGPQRMDAEGPQPLPTPRAVEPQAEPPRTPVDLLADEEAFMAEVRRANPYGQSRRAQALFEQDLAATARQLDQGTPPWAVKPHTDTALPGIVENPRIEMRTPTETVDDVVRRVDPETHRIYTKLQEQRDALRSQIAEIEATRTDVSSSAGVARELNEQIALKEQQLTTLKGKKAAKVQAELDALRAQQQQLAIPQDTDARALQMRETMLRAEMQRLDYEMRDLAVPMSRARAAAEGRMQGPTPDPEVLAVLQARNPGVEELYKPSWMKPAPRDTVTPRASTVDEMVPGINDEFTPPSVRELPPNADAAEKARLVLAEQAKRADEALEVTRSQIDTLRGLTDEMDINGVKYKLDDAEFQIMVPTDDGHKAMTLRQMLDDIADDEAALKAVSSCSVRKTS